MFHYKKRYKNMYTMKQKNWSFEQGIITMCIIELVKYKHGY
jgi:hypothetical protein